MESKYVADSLDVHIQQNHEPMPVSTSSFEQVRHDIQSYVTEVYLRQVYSDHLSGYRTTVHEPQWPTRHGNDGTPPTTPRPFEKSNEILDRVLEPVLAWVRLSEEECQTQDARILLKQILDLLGTHPRADSILARYHVAEGRSFLYRNIPDMGIEHIVLKLINGAHLLIQQNDLTAADGLVDKALSVVEMLRYQPLSAKCWYWKGVLADLRGDYDEAEMAFLFALPCFGKYIEGTRLPSYVRKYRERLIEIIQTESELGDSQQQWVELVVVVAEFVEPKFSALDSASSTRYWPDSPDNAVKSPTSDAKPHHNRPVSLSSERSLLFSELLRETRQFQSADENETSHKESEPSSAVFHRIDDESGSESPSRSPGHPPPRPRRPVLTKEGVLKWYKTLTPEQKGAANMDSLIEGLEYYPDLIFAIAHKANALYGEEGEAASPSTDSMPQQIGDDSGQTQHPSRTNIVENMRERIDQNIADPHEQAYRDLTSADREAKPGLYRIREEFSKLLEESREAGVQYDEDLKEKAPANNSAAPVRSLSQRQRSIAEAMVFSDTPALQQTDATYQSHQREKHIGSEPLSSSPLRKASIPGENTDGELDYVEFP